MALLELLKVYRLITEQKVAAGTGRVGTAMGGTGRE